MERTDRKKQKEKRNKIKTSKKVKREKEREINNRRHQGDKSQTQTFFLNKSHSLKSKYADVPIPYNKEHTTYYPNKYT